jgi:hypothetical protein
MKITCRLMLLADGSVVNASVPLATGVADIKTVPEILVSRTAAANGLSGSNSIPASNRFPPADKN